MLTLLHTRSRQVIVAGLACALSLSACAPARDQTDQVAQADPASAKQQAPKTAQPPSPATAQPEYAITTSKTMPEQAPLDLGLSDADYWDDPFKTRLELENQLLDDEASVLVIGAPKLASFQQRETLPLVVLRVGQQDAMARLPFRRTALVVAVELTTNTTYANLAVIEDIVEPPVYDGPPLEGMSGEAWLIDLRKQLELPWARGDLLVSVIMRDTMTHRVRVGLRKGGYEDPAVAEYLAQADGEPKPAQIWPAPLAKDDGRGLPTYREHADSPAIPAQAGISLAVPRVVPRSQHMRAVVRGSFRLPSLARHRAPADADHTVTVPITLVLTGSDIAAPFVFPLVVPSYDAVKPDGGSEVTGYFSVDLQQLGNLDAIDQTYFIYAFSGEVVTGPAPMALVTR
ncbi:hypothetical protein [Enhygromyxa salina]|nr:hypothetical protein [Enhygromyxa salina]